MSNQHALASKTRPLKRLASWTSFWQVVGILVGMAVVAIPPCLATWPLLLPVRYNLKTTQQVINFLVVAFAIAFGILFRYCLAKTNEQECAADLHRSSLTSLALHTRASVSKQSHWDLLTDFWQHPSTRTLSAFYLASLSLFGAVTWILSSIFILEAVTMRQDWSSGGYYYPLEDDPLSPGIRGILTPVRLGTGIPDGDDTCKVSINSPNCTYDLAISALSAHLITQTHYDYGFIQFDPPYGTRGLPFDVLIGKTQPNLSDVELSQERLVLDYCLPILDPQTVYCHHDKSNSRVSYSKGITVGEQRLISVTINPDTYPDTHHRFDIHNGTMTIAQSLDPSEPQNTIITGSGIYADLLSRLSHGFGQNSAEEIFTVVCTIRTRSTWQWITFRSTRRGTTFLPAIRFCRSGYQEGYGFKNLYYAIEGATRLVTDLDGYTKLFNAGFQDNTLARSEEGDDVFSDNYLYNMTDLESILSQLYEIVQTSFTATAGDDAIATPIKQLIHEHRYRIQVTWTVISDLAMIATSLILLMIVWQAIRWVRAVLSVRETESTQWDLLEPLDLMGYSVIIANDLRAQFEQSSEKKLVIAGAKVKLGVHGVTKD